MSTPTTPGEVAFVTYLDTMGIKYEFEKEWSHTSSKPDFLIQANREYICEVKDLDPIELSPHGGCYDPYSWVRQEITDAKKKFRAFGEHPCWSCFLTTEVCLLTCAIPT